MSATLVIRGDAGTGKTALVEHAVAAARGFAVLRVDGVEREQDLGFGAVHRLLVPVLSQSDGLPSPQKRALDTALGMEDGEPADRFLVGLAILTLLARVAERQPLLCAIDDAQWIDAESADLLAFVARRLFAERVVLLVAARDLIDSRDPFAGLPERRLAGLEAAAASALLASVAPARLDPALVRRIVTETEGNPLALVELGRDIDGSGWATGLLPAEPVPLGRRLEAHFSEQVTALPVPTQRFLLLLAAAPASAPLVRIAAADLGLSEDAAEPAVAARILVDRPALAFRHPLIRAAVYGRAPATERREVHGVLAALVDPSEPDVRAWHLAAAASGPDEETATELQRGADRALAKGGWAARAAFLARAAELTPGGVPLKAVRLVAAAEAALAAGIPKRAQALLDQAEAEPADPLWRAQARRIAAALKSFIAPGVVPAILLEAARDLQPLDRARAEETFIEALQACLVACQLTVGTTPAEVGAAALAAVAPPAGGRELKDDALEGFARRFATGHRAAVPMLRQVVASMSVHDPPPSAGIRWAVLGNNAAADLWDADGFRSMLARLEDSERRRGALETLRITLGGVGHCSMWAGDFAAADGAHTEATQIAVALGDDAATWDALKVELFAWQGRDADTRFVAGLLTSELTESMGAGVAINLARMALVILDVAQGHYEDALGHALRLLADDPCPHGSQVLPDLVEAAVRSGDGVTADAALHRLEERATVSGTPWALGLLARSEALTTDRDPEPAYRRAIDLLESTYVRTDTARAHLLYGEWLRRMRQRTEARDQLRTAFAMFDGMGAAAFAERARIELAATGERARRRSVDGRRELTPQERQIAVLASSGATNQEIAAKLFLSPSTVDYHLRKVFQKLGVRSRRHLGSALLAEPGAE